MSSAGVTGYGAGLDGDQQIVIALKAMAANDGHTDMTEIYRAVEANLSGLKLSDQGRASLRRLINFNAVQAGLVYPHNPKHPGWRITPEGRDYLLVLQQPEPPEEVINVDTLQMELQPANTVRGAAFERYVEGLLKAIYPRYTWYNQGRHKRRERGLDFIGSRLGDPDDAVGSIGVQAKFHAATNAPTEVEWLKFLAGCFARRIDRALFVTSGRLTSEQHREAGEARVIVMEGHIEITRVAGEYGIHPFELFDEQTASAI